MFLLKSVEKCRQVIENFDYRRKIYLSYLRQIYFEVIVRASSTGSMIGSVQNVFEITGSEDVVLK